ncbi:hypothetical protein C4Q28_01105 [Pseudomonas sp. SWI6]|uniref:hypothetical protein n=1 Tax=Pseudomonas sp. SK2 TaxID=2841063 RepID=UPI000CE5D91D|nr:MULTISPECIES: hypothetical protein [Pseudomonas]AVD80849.1 hypothetical protein C4Q28_01105 [Pseudomonas sp. SWI6]MDT8926893.1 hypothetical protein [Pseudomonas taiwanensis]QQZ36327.1 hypothetical protein IF103_24620 [Pseudomonas sp. SK2]
MTRNEARCLQGADVVDICPLKDNINLLAKLDITAKIELVIQGGGSATKLRSGAGAMLHY